MRFTFRPLVRWPYPDTSNRRSRSTFRAGWQDTLDALVYEVEWLGGEDAIIAAGFREQDIRQDGLPRSDARAPSHPGIEVSFAVSEGRLVYATDVCVDWQHNVRSIALGLESLRAVDRYGITRKGEQYAGWLQIESEDDPVVIGRRLVEVAGGMEIAVRLHHPDLGGQRQDFEAVMAYRRSINAPAG